MPTGSYQVNFFCPSVYRSTALTKLWLLQISNFMKTKIYSVSFTFNIVLFPDWWPTYLVNHTYVSKFLGAYNLPFQLQHHLVYFTTSTFCTNYCWFILLFLCCFQNHISKCSSGLLVDDDGIIIITRYDYTFFISFFTTTHNWQPAMKSYAYIYEFISTYSQSSFLLCIAVITNSLHYCKMTDRLTGWLLFYVFNFFFSFFSFLTYFSYFM